MVNIFALYAGVALMCISGIVPIDVVFKLLTSGVIAVINLFEGLSCF